MKRLFIIALAALAGFLFNACEKEGIAPDPTTYTIKMQMSGVTPESKVKLDLIAFEYNQENEKIASNSMNQTNTSDIHTFTANSKSVKIKIYASMSTTLSTKHYWIQQVFYLEPEKNVEIVLKDDTMLGPDEP